MPEPAQAVEGYTRTEMAESELRAPRLGLSLSQRKLLTLVDAPTTIDQLAQSLHSDEARVRRDLARLAELRLVRPNAGKAPSTEPVPLADAVPRARPLSRAGHRRTGMAVTVLIVVAATGIVAWPLRQRGTGESAAPDAPAAAAQPAHAEGPVTPAPAPATVALRAPDVGPGAESRVAATDSSAGLRRPETERVQRPAEPAPARRADSPAATPLPRPDPPAAATAATAVAKQAIAPQAAPASMVEATRAEAPAMRAVSLPSEPVASPTVARGAPEPVAPMSIATAAPTTLPQAAPKPRLVPVVREEPEFPREAVLSNVTGGRVIARLTIDRDGRVSNVDIVSAEPRRVFDRSVSRALSRWRFEPSTDVRTTDVEVDFKGN